MEKKKDVTKILSMARNKIAEDLDLIDKNKFAFCWIVDYPMYEFDENSKKIIFSHNPFSMPQGNIKDLNLKDPLNIKKRTNMILSVMELNYPLELLEIIYLS